jgi:putative FmdB family regulatory protein
MPRYEFRCESCEKRFDVTLTLTLTLTERANAEVKCPNCGSGQVTPQLAVFTAKTSRKS